jgi:hypothetical protein
MVEPVPKSEIGVYPRRSEIAPWAVVSPAVPRIWRMESLALEDVPTKSLPLESMRAASVSVPAFETSNDN